MPENTEQKTRRSRVFLYQKDDYVVIGRQKVRYEPDAKKNIFGAIAVETIFPKQREAKHSFELGLYPDVHEDNPSLNIIQDVDQGCHLLFIEANRSAALQSRALTHIPKDKFSYKDMLILTEEMLNPENATDAYILKGVIAKRTKYLRSGDIIDVSVCREEKDEKTGKAKVYWVCKWDPFKTNWKWYECVRKFWIKHFGNKQLYSSRYTQVSYLTLDPTEVHIVTGNPVEENTDRG